MKRPHSLTGAPRDGGTGTTSRFAILRFVGTPWTTGDGSRDGPLYLRRAASSAAWAAAASDTGSPSPRQPSTTAGPGR